MPPPTPGEECRVVLLSPFDIHFSQTRIRTEFQDSRTTEEAISQIKAVALGHREPKPAETPEKAADGAEPDSAADAATPASETGVAAGSPGAEGDEYGLGEGADDLSEEKRGKEFEMLWHPFPRIEVTKWRCKLREPDGSPKLDPTTGLELYSHEERWFSFDNRRLYCLQKAAVDAYPKELRCEVVEIPMAIARMRELRKFDTKTYGCSVLAGRRDDPNLETWSWRIAVGLPEEAQPEEGVARQKSMRWRGQKRGNGPNSGNSRNKRQESGDGQQEGHGLELMRSALLFFLVYLGLRVVVSIFRHRFQSTGAGAVVGAVGAAIIPDAGASIPAAVGAAISPGG